MYLPSQTLGEQTAQACAHYSPEYRAAVVREAIATGIRDAFGSCHILGIDAWRNGDDWTWNNCHAVGRFPLALLAASPRRILRELRTRGFLAASSVGRVALTDDGYSLTIKNRATGEPLFAIEYGAVKC